MADPGAARLGLRGGMRELSAVHRAANRRADLPRRPRCRGSAGRPPFRRRDRRPPQDRDGRAQLRKRGDDVDGHPFAPAGSGFHLLCPVRTFRILDQRHARQRPAVADPQGLGPRKSGGHPTGVAVVCPPPPPPPPPPPRPPPPPPPPTAAPPPALCPAFAGRGPP